MVVVERPRPWAQWTITGVSVGLLPLPQPVAGKFGAGVMRGHEQPKPKYEQGSAPGGGG